MNRLIIITIMLILFSIVTTAVSDTYIDKDKAFTTDTYGSLSQQPYKIKKGDIVNLSLDTTFTKKIDMCFRFNENINYFDIVIDDIKVKDVFDKSFCIKNIKPKYDYNLSITYNRFGEAKYDIIILPSSYSFDIQSAVLNDEIIVLDPVVIGTTEFNMTFDYEDGTYNSTFAEELVGGYNGVVNGATLGLGYIGGAYSFDGVNDYIKTKWFNSSYPSMTMSFWMKPTTLENGDYLFDYNGTSTLNRMSVAFVGAPMQFSIWDNTGGFIIRTTTTSLSLNKWTHIIVTSNGTNSSIYFNGTKQDGTFTDVGAPHTYLEVNKTLFIGSTKDLAGQYEGYVDDIFMWEGYVNDSQALEIYNIYNQSIFTVLFKDETTQTQIDSLNTTKIVDGVSSTQETQNGYLTIRGGTNINLTAYSSLYPARIRYFTSTSGIQTDTMYMLSATELQGVTQTFQTIDAQTEDSLPSVYVSITTLVGASTVTVAQGYSDSAGLFNFWGNGAKTYTATFTKSGYSTLVDSFSPSIQNRQEFMSPISSAANQSLLTGQTYDYAPKFLLLQNESNYNFTFNITSSISNITACNLTLLDQDNNILNSTIGTFNSTFCNATIQLNTYNYSGIVSKLYYEKNSLLNSSYAINYQIDITYQGNSSLQNFIDDIDTFAASGFDDFGRAILAFLVVLLITSSVGATVKIFQKEPEAEIILFLACVWMVSSFGWLTVNNEKIANIGIPGLGKWIVFFMYFMAGIGLLAPKFSNN